MLTVLAALCAAGNLIPSPWVLQRPGPVVDAFDEITVDDEVISVITVQGAETFDVAGEIQILSVNVRGTPEHRLSWFAAVPGFIDKTQTLVPIEQVYPEDTTGHDRSEYNSALMSASQIQATAAALTYLGMPPAAVVTVTAVSEGGAASELLRVGDEILSVGGVPVSSVTDIRSVLAGSEAEAAVTVAVLRASERQEIPVVPTRASENQPPILGIEAAVTFSFPFDVEIELDQIGGPSAGLSFGLALIELLDEESILAGHVVSATGTLSADGTVGPIGGLAQKIWGASRAQSEAVLFPVGNCADVPLSPHKICSSLRLTPSLMQLTA